MKFRTEEAEPHAMLTIVVLSGAAYRRFEADYGEKDSQRPQSDGRAAQRSRRRTSHPLAGMVAHSTAQPLRPFAFPFPGKVVVVVVVPLVVPVVLDSVTVVSTPPVESRCSAHSKPLLYASSCSASG